MKNEKYEISIVLTLEDRENKYAILVSLKPENSTMPEGSVDSEIIKGKIVTNINGKMSIGRAMNTLDDVLNTAILSQKIASD